MHLIPIDTFRVTNTTANMREWRCPKCHRLVSFTEQELPAGTRVEVFCKGCQRVVAMLVGDGKP
jgi:phage FluMu protein Com